MINGMTLMLYVRNVQRAANFWTSIGFEELMRVKIDEISESIVLSNDDFGNVSLQLYDIDFIKKNNPEIQPINPKIMFSTDDIDEAYEAINKETKRISDITPVDDDYSFTFKDLENNEYSVRGARYESGLTKEIAEDYYKHLKNARLVSARDIEFLPDRSVLFFGKVTDKISREFSEKLSEFPRTFFYVDMEPLALSPDLQKIAARYKIDTTPALVRRFDDGSFEIYDNTQTLKEFLNAK